MNFTMGITAACIVIGLGGSSLSARMGEAASHRAYPPSIPGRSIIQPRVPVPPRVSQPSESRSLHRLMLAPVITSISRDHGSWLDLIIIHGTNFAGAFNSDSPIDPHFNTVWFGYFGQAGNNFAVKATHVPVTSTLMYAIVPSMPDGDVTIKVQTRWGFSNPVHFKVERAWWYFW